jgi:hypothetical protein
LSEALLDICGDFIDEKIGADTGYVLILATGEADADGNIPINYRGNMNNETAVQILDMVRNSLDSGNSISRQAH